MSIETTPNSRDGIETWKSRELARNLPPRDRPSIYRHRTRRPSVSGSPSSTHGRRKCSVRARCSDSMAPTPAGQNSLRWWLDRGAKDPAQETDELFHRMAWEGLHEQLFPPDQTIVRARRALSIAKGGILER